MIKYELRKYLLHNSQTSEMEEYVVSNSWETARAHIVQRALEMREESQEEDTYLGIQLGLEILDLSVNQVRFFKVLTGDRMPTQEILKHLDAEREILQDCGFDLETIETNFNDVLYTSVAQYFITLYYFTAL